ncbi:MAG: preprotein translocase subunit YajC [Neisseriaceae bacterium]|nr:preprotein translocase subunit YajC [Neisseriaceae bacterium PsAf]MCV2503931.1 preprotein translocase subunit YajC [Neisseriaceae bacterium]MCV2508879.1 preprotein translocase subunit YajC [Neisseriaceae bacterium]
MFDIAFAADAAATSSMWSGVFLIVSIFFLFWFLIIRPQSKKMKEHQNLVNSLQRGDKVLTHSGIIGKITKVGDTNFTIEIANNVEVLIDKNYIARKYEPVATQSKPTKK